MSKQTSYTKEELLAWSGELFGAGNVQLPLPPMLMFDRIVLSSQKRAAGGAAIIAELMRTPTCVFDCHFCFADRYAGLFRLDAMWQLVGFYLGWKGGPGRGRALGAREEFKKLLKDIDLKDIIMRKLVMGIADARMEVDGREIYVANDLRVGLFTTTDNF